MAGTPADSERKSSTETPAKPHESGSRQQTHPEQQSQTGSPSYDRQTSERSGGGDTRARPDNPK